MSYATATSHNPLPSPTQPEPDPMLNTSQGFAPNAVDTENKVKVTEPTSKEHPSAKTTVNPPSPESEYNYDENASHGETEGQADTPRVEQKGSQLWGLLKEQLLRPGVAGGLLGIVNVGLVGTLSYQLYTRPNLRTDSKALGGSAAGAFVILAAEGYLAEAYRNTAQGKEEEKRAREEGAALYKHTKEIVLRPSAFGGLLGILNLGIIGGVSYIAYSNWDQPQWDRKTLSVATVGLLSLVVCEGVLAEKYKEKEYPKRR